jgi:hypothetical protein
MAKCPNRNIPEYQTLLAEFKTNIDTDNIINSWQKLTRTDEFPTVDEATNLVADRKVKFSLDKREFTKAIVANLSRLNIIHQYQGVYYLTRSLKGSLQTDPEVIKNNKARFDNYLSINNISNEAVTLEDTRLGYKVVVHDNIFTPKDILPESRLAKSPYSMEIMNHLQKLFPQIKIKVATPEVAKEYYDLLSDSMKAKLPFDKIKSFYIDGHAILIKGRVTLDTAIEEVLHPFTDALKIDNPQLFDSLYKDASKNFPELKQAIDDSYTIYRGFTDIDRQLELVTQALVRHFRNEYETKPTESFLNKIQQFLKWFASVVEKVHAFLTGSNIQETKTTEIQQETKPGVEELFDSNPKLANEVYSALGFTKEVNNVTLYHGTANAFKGEFDISKSNTSDTIFLTDSEVFANEFSFNDEFRPDGVTYTVTANLQKTFDSNSDEAIKELEPLIRELVAENYTYKTGLNYRTDLKQINIGERVIEDPTQEDFVQHYLWRAKSNWRLMESPRVIEYLKSKGYDSFTIKERGANNIAVFDKSKVRFEKYKDKAGNETIVNSNNQITPQQKQQAIQLYSQYLDTVFPDSKVKDVKQHATETDFESFTKEGSGRLGKGFYFSDFGNNYIEGENVKKKLVLLNIKNPLNIQGGQFMKDVYKLLDDRKQSSDDTDAKIQAQKDINNQYKQKADALIGDKNGVLNSEIKVFESEQIHILGSKQDIEGFKKFVAESSTKQVQKQVDAASTFTAKVSDINPKLNLSDIAAMLNSTDLQFKLESKVNSKIRYSLSKEKQKTVDYVMGKSNAVQQAIVKKLFHVASSKNEEIESLSANYSDITEENDIVILNEKDHVYYNITTGESDYKSVTTVIKGAFKNKLDRQLNLDLGNDFDRILDAVASDKTFEEIADKLLILNKDTAKQAYSDLTDIVINMTKDGSVIIPQVVLFDNLTKIAGTADLLLITPQGKIKIIDLKTSKNSVIGNEDEYDNEWALDKESRLVKQNIATKLSTRQQHNLQVNIYRRLIENMGYEVSTDVDAAKTLHIKLDIKGTPQEFTGDFKIEGWVDHPASQNLVYVDKLLTYNPSLLVDEEFDNLKLDNPDDSAIDDEFLDMDEEFPDTEEQPETKNGIFKILMEYRDSLAKRKDALKLVKDTISMDRTKKQTIDGIESSIVSIMVALQGTTDQMSATYTSLLRDAIKQVNVFMDYMLEPANFTKAEYITYALNFERFIGTFQGLYTIGDSTDINSTQRDLILTLQEKLNKLVGYGSEEGIINAAITNYVKEIIRSKSNQSFSEDELDELMTMARDITGIQYQAYDMATSKDTFLAIIDKIHKAKKQEFLNKLELREYEIKAAAAKLLKLSPTTNTQKIYTFMQEFDDDGKSTGRYVERLGKQYYDKKEKLYNALKEGGIWREYRDIDNLDTAYPEDIEYNKKLYADKKAYAQFFNAETIGDNNQPVDGMYHKYTKEFKEIRKQYESFVPKGVNGFWVRKSGISDTAYTSYRLKYYESKYAQVAETVNGVFTGKIYDSEVSFVKPQYKVARDESSNGEDMLNPKYEAIMKPTTALGQAQKEYYEMYVKHFENDLLNKLDIGTRDKMLGRMPVVKKAFMEELKEKPNLIVKLWAKVTRSVKNFTTETSDSRRVIIDENENLVDSLPIYYTSDLRVDGELEIIENKITALNEKRKQNLIKIYDYKKELQVLETQANKLRNTPSGNEIDLDMTRSLLKFAGMAEHYETMGSVEDTFKAMIEVLTKRTALPEDEKITNIAKVSNNLGKRVDTIIGRSNKQFETNTLRRAKKWMQMVYYNNEEISKGKWSKITDAVISASSLSYVAFNPFGSMNNYVMGRINNMIEMVGGRFFERRSYLKAELEFNKSAYTDIFKRLSTNIVKGKKGYYDIDKPLSKFEALINTFRMMDDMNDVNETLAENDERSYLSKLKNFGYSLNKAGEYSVQTKVGMALVIDTTIKNSFTGETLSLYDAFEYDSKAQDLKLKPGFDTIVKRNNIEVPFNNDFKYSLQNEIREVNKQIHGNYAKDDRMVIQSNALGKLMAQFHKWVVPALRSRFGKEYYDENLGWMEGRYISFIKFMQYVISNIADIDIKANKWRKGFTLDHTEDITAKYTKNGKLTISQEMLEAKINSENDRVKNEVFGVYRTIGELAIMMTVMAIGEILRNMWGDDDDDETVKRLKNIMIYQADRSYKEMVTFIPIFPTGLEQLHQMADSPVAATRLLGELGEALSSSMMTGLNGVRYFITDNKENWEFNKDVFYQRKPNKGKLKMNKQWMDVIPGLYSIQKWDAYLRMKDFYIK